MHGRDEAVLAQDARVEQQALHDGRGEQRAAAAEQMASEARASGTDTGALELRLQSCRKHADNLNDLVERQQTIKKLWSQPTQAFKRKEAEVKCLQSRLNLALGL